MLVFFFLKETWCWLVRLLQVNDDVSSPETCPHSSWQALLRKGLTYFFFFLRWNKERLKKRWMSKGATRPVTTLRWLWRAADWFLNKLRSRKMRWHLFGRWRSERTIVNEHDRFFKSKFQCIVSTTWAHNGHMYRVVTNCSETITQLSTILCQNYVYCVNYKLNWAARGKKHRSYVESDLTQIQIWHLDAVNARLP